MDYKEQTEKRVNDAVLGMITYLNYAVAKADRKPSIEVAETIKALTEGIARLLPHVSENKKEEKVNGCTSIDNG